MFSLFITVDTDVMAKPQLKFLMLCSCILLSPTEIVCGETTTTRPSTTTLPSTTTTLPSITTTMPSTTAAYLECITSLRNTVVYEGTLNTMLNCAAEPKGSAWSIKPTSNYYTSHTITSSDDALPSALTGLYAINQSGLTVRNATTTSTGGPISTAGLYLVPISITTNQAAVKLVVIRSGPICSYSRSTSDAVNFSCTIIYADHPVAPFNAIMKWTKNGEFHTTDTPTRTAICPFMYNSSSTITVDYTVPATYDCQVTFTSPADNIVEYPYIARNSPDFSATCTLTTRPISTTPPPATAAFVTDGVKIGVGVGVGVGGLVIVGGILLCVLCMRRHRIRRTKPDNQRADGMYDMGSEDTERTGTHRMNAITPHYEPLNVLPAQNPSAGSIMTTTTDADENELYDRISDSGTSDNYDSEINANESSLGEYLHVSLQKRELQSTEEHDVITPNA